MIIMLFIYALISVFISILFFRKKKGLIGGMFVLLAILLSIVAIVTIVLYPQTWPF
jgi:hypothetical protein